MPIRRATFKEAFIKDVTSKDYKVAVSGIIVTKTRTTLLLDDSTGQALIDYEGYTGIIPDGFVRILGFVIPTENGVQIKAHAIQDYNTVHKQGLMHLKELLR